MECAAQLETSGLDVEMVLAGPMDEETRRIVEPRRAQLSRCHYRGALGPAEVSRFYAEIDVFLFPTRHPHEAEPLVVLDALAAGVPVIATDRGCIAYLLDESSGSIAVSSEAFVERAVDQIRRWAEDRDALARASQGARARLETLQGAAEAELPAVLQMLCRASSEGVLAADYAGDGGRGPRTATDR
jgi:glycosyltransferase involved in cell wall biosynthesis